MTESYGLAFVTLSVGSFLAVPLVLSVRSVVPTEERALGSRRARLTLEFVWQIRLV